MTLRTERGELYEAVELKWQVCASALLAGRPREAGEMFAELGVQAARVANAGAAFACRWVRENHHFMTTGDLLVSDQRLGHSIEWTEQHGHAFVAAFFTLRGLVRFYAGDWEAACTDYDTALRLDNPSFTDGWFSTAALLAGAYAGDDVLARLQATRIQALEMHENNPVGLWELAYNVVEGLAIIGRTREGRRPV